MDWAVFVVCDTYGLKWLIYSVNKDYAALRIKDFGIHATETRLITEEESELYAAEVDVAKYHKNIAVFVKT